MNVDIRHDEARRTFRLAADGGEAVLSYAPLDDVTVDFQSTFVPLPLRGRGLGNRLVLAALDWARSRDLKVVASCWFVGSVVARHPEYRALLAS